MELTPEERQRIYEEEKARLEARKTLEAEAPARKRPGLLMGCLWLIGGIFVLLIIASLFSQSKRPHYDESRLMDDINSSAKIQKLHDAGVIHQVQSFGTGVSVVVGENFYPLSFDQKGAALKMVASVVREDRGGDHFVLYDSRTDKKIGSWSSEYGLNLE